MEEPKVVRRKIGDQSYAVFVNGARVGTVTKTGTHLDFYPWDWMLDDGVEPYTQKNGYTYHSTGCSDTLYSGVSDVAAATGAWAKFRESQE